MSGLNSPLMCSEYCSSLIVRASPAMRLACFVLCALRSTTRSILGGMQIFSNRRMLAFPPKGDSPESVWTLICDQWLVQRPAPATLSLSISYLRAELTKQQWSPGSHNWSLSTWPSVICVPKTCLFSALLSTLLDWADRAWRRSCTVLRLKMQQQCYHLWCLAKRQCRLHPRESLSISVEQRHTCRIVVLLLIGRQKRSCCKTVKTVRAKIEPASGTVCKAEASPCAMRSQR